MEEKSTQPPSGGAAPSPHDELTFNTTPNQLTLLRMVFVPVVMGMLFVQKPGWDMAAAWTFGVAGATDYFDGYLARTHKVVTVYGKLMDPLADKFLVVCSAIMLQYLGRIHPVIVMLLVCRELGITGLRALASAEGVIIAASGGGKWKTVAQMIALPFIMVPQGFLGIPLYPIGHALLYISLALSLWSAKDYVVEFFRGVRENRKQKAQERRIAREARLAARAQRMAAKAARLKRT